MFIQTVVAVATAFAPAPIPAQAQAQAEAEVEQLVGRWEGSLTLPDGSTYLRVVLRVSKGADGTVTAVSDDPTQGTMDVPVTNLTLDNGAVHFEVSGVDGHAEARLAGDTITGSWVGPEGSLPLSLTRVPAT